jgi:hypothetical protein
MSKSALRHQILRALVVVVAMVSVCTGCRPADALHRVRAANRGADGDTGRANLGRRAPLGTAAASGSLANIQWVRPIFHPRSLRRRRAWGVRCRAAQWLGQSGQRPTFSIVTGISRRGPAIFASSVGFGFLYPSLSKRRRIPVSITPAASAPG